MCYRHIVCQFQGWILRVAAPDGGAGAGAMCFVTLSLAGGSDGEQRWHAGQDLPPQT